MLKRLDRRLLLSPGDVTASDDSLEVIGTFNPGVAEHDGEIVLLVRVAERPCEKRGGFTALPRWQDDRVVTDWIDNREIESPDARVVRLKRDGLLRLTFTSHLQVFCCSDGQSIDHAFVGTKVFPCTPYESFGLEDPRITLIDGVFWITYVAVSPHGAGTALASTTNFQQFERHGMIFCPENKDVVLFPEKIDDQFVALHRPTTAHPFCRPEMWIGRSPDLINWGSHKPLHGGAASWESERVGGGVSPFRTNAGWLEIYHASRRTEVSGQVGTYAAGAMLLDLEDPSRVIGKTSRPLWEPNAEFETSGFVPNVVFPTGAIVREDSVQLFYGAGDTYTATAAASLSEIISKCFA